MHSVGDQGLAVFPNKNDPAIHSLNCRRNVSGAWSKTAKLSNTVAWIVLLGPQFMLPIIFLTYVHIEA